MLKNILDHEPVDLDSEKLGVVVDNMDPLFLERVKVRIPGIFDDPDHTKYAWIGPSGTGRSTNSGSEGHVDPPAIGATVIVKFQKGDLHYGLYHGSPLTSQTLLDEFKTNYPNRRGRKDSAGHIFIVDKTPGQKLIQVTHGSGTAFIIIDNGTINITGVADLNANITGNAAVSVQGDCAVSVEGNCTLTVHGQLNTSAAGGWTHTGNLTVEQGYIHVPDGDVVASSVSEVGHIHSGVLSGGADTGPPVA